MNDAKNSLILTAALFAIATAIAFHAWWPSYKADRNLERYVVGCMPIDDGSISLSDIPEKGVDLLPETRWTSERKSCVKEYYFLHSDRVR